MAGRITVDSGIAVLLAVVAIVASAGNRASGQVGENDGSRRPKYGLRTSGENPCAEHVALGLNWLARHQDPRGFWSCAEFSRRCENGECDGAGSEVHDIGVTGLALLAFGGVGNTISHGAHKRVVRRGVKYLQGVQDPDSGCFGEVDSHDRFLLDHALATLAMIEAYGLCHWPILKEPAQRGVNFILKAHNPGSGWRYTCPPDGQSDVEMTAWMLVCLKTAEDFGLDVDATAIEDGRRYIDEMTDRQTWRTGYQSTGGYSNRDEGVVDRWPDTETEAMTAAAMLCRLLLGENPKTSPALRGGAALLLEQPPLGDEDAGLIDFYYWFYGSHAMFLIGGEEWDSWELFMIEAVARTQRVEGDERGSWDPQVDPWGHVGGRVYSTALLTLCLEVYHRYDPALVNRSDTQRVAVESPAETQRRLKGRVLSTDGTPIEGAQVIFVDGDAQILASLETDAAGHFFITVDADTQESGDEVLRELPDVIQFTADGFATKLDQHALFGPSDPRWLDLAEWEPGLRLRPGFVEVTLEPAATVRGTIRWDDGTPCVGATIRPGPVQDTGYGDGLWWLGPLVPAVTDEDGRFEIPSLPASTLLETRIRIGEFNAFEQPYLSVPPAGQTATVSWTLTRPAEVEVIVAGAEALAVEGPRVVLRDSTVSDPSRGWRGGQPIEDGRAVFTGFPPGSLMEVHIGAEGYEPQMLLDQVRLDGGRTTLHVAAPPSLTPITAAPHPRPRSWTFGITFVASGEGPISVERFLLEAGIQEGDFTLTSPDGAHVYINQAMADLYDRRSSASCTVHVEGPSPARVVVGLRGRTLFSGTASEREWIFIPFDIDAYTADRVSVIFRGRTAAHDPEPIQRIHIENIDTGEFGWFGSLAMDGIVRVHLEPGRYVYRAFHHRLACGIGSLNVTPGSAHEVTVVLPEFHVLEGNVTPASGDDVLRSVSVLQIGEPLSDHFAWQGSGPVAPSGEYRCANLAPGNHLLTVLTYDADRHLVAVHQEPVQVGPERITVRDVHAPLAATGHRFRFEFGDQKPAMVVARSPDGVPLFAGLVLHGSEAILPADDLVFLAYGERSSGQMTGFAGKPVRGVVTRDGDVRCVTFDFDDEQ